MTYFDDIGGNKMNVSSVSVGSTGGASSSIDAQIAALNKRKMVLFKRMSELGNSGDSQKVKEEKMQLLKLEIGMIDMQIAQLMQKKMEMQKKNQKDAMATAADSHLPPSPSDMLFPEKGNKNSDIPTIDIRL